MQINAAISTMLRKGGGDEPGAQREEGREWEEKNGIITSSHLQSVSHPG